jgi:TetR/AcrR family transcriptional regulator, cholesterol catabolism regulator
MERCGGFAMRTDAPHRYEGTEGRVLRAAVSLFAETGYHGTSMRQIAAAADLKAGSIYNHFTSKAEILAGAIYGTSREYIDGVLEAIRGVKTAPDKLRAALAWHIEYHVTRSEEVRVADRELNALPPDVREAVLAIRDSYQVAFESVLQQGERENAWRVPDIPVVSFALLTMWSSVEVWYRSEGRLSLAEIIEVYTELALAMVGDTHKDGACSQPLQDVSSTPRSSPSNRTTVGGER